ncbi:hypothetical protein CROQUDRAFT_71355 [Cronartium quercuum f. sp. fusiforme G11]|uniref:Oligopeptide transporter n=1 Tax=Cronartium quercuum f. sp. fusiforme G11 TaxID=708437 RepID=A0A9P6NTL8_9BASI|nr:hypothetical protein CROQUDRAFT_71355 [Cronartium quercuum f. sp. fusiforme G11]
MALRRSVQKFSRLSSEIDDTPNLPEIPHFRAYSTTRDPAPRLDSRKTFEEHSGQEFVSDDSGEYSYERHVALKLKKLESKSSWSYESSSEEFIQEETNCAASLSSSITSSHAGKSMTLRSTLIGIIGGILGAALTQLFYFKPASIKLQPIALRMLCFVFGLLLAKIPGPRWWNPGPFSQRETTFASIIATSGNASIAAMQIVAAERMLFSRAIPAHIELAMLFSSQVVGYGWAGLLQPLLVYPARATFPAVLPSVALIRSLAGDSRTSQLRVRFFVKVAIGTILYQILPCYIAPTLRGMSLACVLFPTSQMVTYIFGGAHQEEGFGLLSLSLDWTTVGTHGPLYTPLNALYHHLAGWLMAIAMSYVAYKGSWFGRVIFFFLRAPSYVQVSSVPANVSIFLPTAYKNLASGADKDFPFISSELYTYDAKIYPVKKVITSSGIPLSHEVAKYGLPFIPTVVLLAGIFECLATSSALTNVILQNFSTIKSIMRGTGTAHVVADPDRSFCKQHYHDFPKTGFLAISITAGLIALCASILSGHAVPFPELSVSLLLSACLILSVGFLSSYTGYDASVTAVVQMIGGMCFPGNVIGNMWFTSYGTSTVDQGLSMLKDLKLAQYMHVPPIFVVLGKILGTCIGVLTSWAVARVLIKNIENNPHLLAEGHGSFSDNRVLEFEAGAISWGAFAKHLYTSEARYFALPLSFVVGFILPVPFFLIEKIWPKCGIHKFHLPLLLAAIGGATHGVTSGKTMGFFICIFSQLWVAKKYPSWYKKYNLILSAALTVGTQVTVIVVSFLLQGGAGIVVEFPNHFLNPPSTQNLDYCKVKPPEVELEED